MVKECEVFSTKLPCRGQKTIRPSHLTEGYTRTLHYLDRTIAPRYCGMKPTDLKSIKHRIAQLQNVMEKVQKWRISVEQDDASVFTKTGKLKSGLDRFDEKCVGVLTSLKTKMQQSQRKRQTLEHKSKRMQPVANSKEDLHPKRKGKKNRAPNQTSVESSVKRKVVKEFFLQLLQVHVHMGIK